MARFLVPIASLLLSVAVLLIGHGLQLIGSFVGPTLTAPLMSGFGPGAMFGFAAVSYSVTAIWCIVRLRGHTASRSHFQPYAPLPETTQCVIDLDPRKAA